ncbi:cyclodeaminase/cyclohydrolase family protein [Stackebrandtia soli]|uniref:cyclodeaminase/cyclohydrolase family protein n=1 Tax=Stackebrandtia soli TaxID=1892856 RepID=UPI0039ED10F6
MRDHNIGEWLDDLASDSPAPGGGAAAAMNVALGAALISMVCNLTIGKPKYAEHELLMADVLSKATELRAEALRLAEADAAAFSGVMDAYGLPRGDDAQKAERSVAIQRALVAAADVPMRIGTIAADVIALAGRILDGANVNVLSDVAVAADSAGSALRSARINVEINRASIKDEGLRAELASRLEELASAELTAGAIVDIVMNRIKK